MFTVVSDQDDVRESHHLTVTLAMRAVHDILTREPMAEVTVLAADGSVVYDVLEMDSCTLHPGIGGFSKERNCPSCSLALACEGCGALAGEECYPGCLGLAD